MAKQLADKNTKEDTTALEQAPPSAALTDLFAEDAGSNTFDSDDLAVPFVRVLQKGSPQVNERDPLYIQGAKPGMFFNTSSNRIYEGEKEGLIMIPIHYTPSYVEWKPNRQGFARDHGADDSIMKQARQNEKGDWILPNGNLVVRSGNYYVYIYDRDTQEIEQAVFALSGSGLKVSRKWNTMIRTLLLRKPDGTPFNPAMFYMAYQVLTKWTKNDEGDWYTYEVHSYKPTVDLDPKIGIEIYKGAREFKKLIEQGAVKVATDKSQDAGGDGVDKDVPF